MGRDYAQSTYERYCSLTERELNCEHGPALCINRAKFVAILRSWNYEIGKGKEKLLRLRTCHRHSMMPGYRGVNFVVMEVKKL